MTVRRDPRTGRFVARPSRPVKKKLLPQHSPRRAPVKKKLQPQRRAPVKKKLLPQHRAPVKKPSLRRPPVKKKPSLSPRRPPVKKKPPLPSRRPPVKKKLPLPPRRPPVKKKPPLPPRRVPVKKKPPLPPRRPPVKKKPPLPPRRPPTKKKPPPPRRPPVKKPLPPPRRPPVKKKPPLPSRRVPVKKKPPLPSRRPPVKKKPPLPARRPPVKKKPLPVKKKPPLLPRKKRRLPARELPAKKKPPKKRRYPTFMGRAAAADELILSKLGVMMGALVDAYPGLDVGVKSFVNADGTVDGELRMRDLPDEWRTVDGMPDLVAALSDAVHVMGAFPTRPTMGGAFWVSFGLRFGPKDLREVEEMAKAYKRFRGLFQVGAYHSPASVLSAILNNALTIRHLVETMWEKRDLPPVQLLVRVVWTPDGQRPGRFAGEEGSTK